MPRDLYHCTDCVPMDGWLYPLNVLQEKAPALFDLHMRKYEDREEGPEKPVPGLECMWGDVVLLTAVHPEKILEALREAGAKPHPIQYYVISTVQIHPADCQIYLFGDKRYHEEHEQFLAYMPEAIDRFQDFPSRTRLYYKKAIDQGISPLLFQFIPHFLYHGKLWVGDQELSVAK